METTFKKSESIKEIAQALSTFHEKVGAIVKDADNPFFKSKYSSLDSIINTIKPALKESGLAFSQFPTGENGLTTILMHSTSGEWLEASYTVPLAKNDPQGAGSAITYMRRYALGAILGLATETDDDGNSASTPSKPTVKAIPEAIKKAVADCTTEEQLKTVWEKNKGLGADFAKLVTEQKKFILSAVDLPEIA